MGRRAQRARGWFRRMDPPLSSPGILGTLGVGVLPGGWPLLVCQYWRGRSLEAFLRSGEVPQLPLILQIARQLALALDEAHRLGQTHGDLRADDVWLGRQANGSERAMVLGFQPRGSTETGAALVARDLDAFGDLLSLMVASLLPRYGFAANRAACADQARENGLYMVIVGPLARIAARCQRSSSERHYVTAADVASALERVEAIAARFGGL
jgi:eukaryotic-like serine/threonine-protein kinase